MLPLVKQKRCLLVLSSVLTERAIRRGEKQIYIHSVKIIKSICFLSLLMTDFCTVNLNSSYSQPDSFKLTKNTVGLVFDVHYCRGKNIPFPKSGIFFLVKS